jgi:hypothetical protein
MNVGRSTVSQTMDVELELFRSQSLSASTWLTDQCFELYIESPYKNLGEYKTFDTTQPPTCTPTSAGVTLSCNLKADEEATTLQFKFTNLEAMAVN